MPRTNESHALTDLILEIFRLNGHLLTAGDQLMEPLGLTSARWQVLGAIDLADRPLTVAQIGRRMGLARQSVQRTVNDLERLGFITLEANPDHARARLVVLTEKARSALKEVDGVQAAWSGALAEGLSAERLTEAAGLLHDLTERLTASGGRARSASKPISMTPKGN